MGAFALAAPLGLPQRRCYQHCHLGGEVRRQAEERSVVVVVEHIVAVVAVVEVLKYMEEVLLEEQVVLVMPLKI